MDSKDLGHGHGLGGDHQHVLACANSAVSHGDTELLIECATQLFEPHHDDQNARRFLLIACDLLPGDGRPLFWLAKIALHRDCDDDRAREYVEAALTREPDRPECLSLLVSLLLDRDLARCTELANRLRRRAPDWPHAHSIWAQVMERTGRLDEAQSGYSEALRLIERTGSGGVPGTYFEEVISGRRAGNVTKKWLWARLEEVKRAKLL